MNVRDLFNDTPSGLGFSLRREEVSEYFKIDGESRVITPPTDFKNFGVESDENSKRVWFEAPRIVGDEIDLSTHNLYVNYQNANGEKDKDIVDDVEVVDDKIYFSWCLSRKAARYKGTLSFIVCAIKTNSRGVIQTEWNTTLCTGEVLQGLEVENPEIPVEESDLINQLIDLVRSTSSKAVADVEAAKTEAIASIETAGSPIFANALKATASGEVVRVDDVSPLGHMARAKVSGKNKYYAHATRELSMSGVIISMEEKKSQFTIDGTATKEFSFTCGSDIVFPKGTYTVSVIGLNTNGVDRVYLTDISEKTIFANFIYPNTPKTVVMDSDVIIRVKGVLAANSVYENGSVLIQIEENNTVTEYEPFIDPTTVTVTRYGADESDNPQTFTPEADGTVLIPSLSPTMTLFADTAGVNIDLEYNRDTNKVVSELQRIVDLLYTKSLVRTVTLNLLASNWVATDEGYSQTLSIADITPYSKVDLQLSAEQLAIFYEKDIAFVTENDNGVVTVFCIGQKPTNDYIMQATITEVVEDE